MKEGHAMWKKEDAEKGTVAQPETPGHADRPAPRRTGGDPATIGRSITIRGEVTGDEDLVIQGRVEGSVDLKQHSVTVGPEGEVKADINGRVVTVEGHVEGNLRADEQVVLRSSARVHGDISAPRIMLEDGAYFRGGVEMAEAGGRTRTGEAASGSAAKGPDSAGAQRPPADGKSGAGDRSTVGGETARTEAQPGSAYRAG
jgi:cytoskeletal protein CcmA (bactofilin family)